MGNKTAAAGDAMGLRQAVQCLVAISRLRSWVFVVFTFGIGLGCDGYMSSGNASLDQPTLGRDAARDASPPPSDIGDDPDRSRNWSIFERLKPSCQACHLQASSQPMFASLEAFENLLVYNIHFVVPGDPDASELIALLEGRGTRQFEQMPVGEKSFGELEAEGNTEITIEEVREFIRQLEPRQGGDGGNAQAALMRRLSARQIQRALQTQLGLTNDDLTPNNRGRAETYPIRDPKQIPLLARFATGYAYERWSALGGSDHLAQIVGNRELSPAFGQHFTQMSQAWCRLAVQKPDNDVIFPHVDPSLASTQAAADIKKNIEFMHLSMLGVVASAEEVDGLYDDVFRYYEQRSGVEAAWTATCATLVRDPLWLSY